MKQIEKWITIALVNLAIVASLGLLLRAKMLFSMPYIDFKNVLHAHSHYAFAGWVTLAILALMVYQVLPPNLHQRKVYKWLLAGLLATSVGMLASFPIQGYGLYSILFSTLFIFITYAFAFVFLKDIQAVRMGKAVKVLTVSALIYLVISSVGPFTLAYCMATKSADAVLYKNAIYTYLHLQYSGFFTLGIFALAFHKVRSAGKFTSWFAYLLVISVLPSMFASYLWSYPGATVYYIAIAGSLLLLFSLIAFFAMLYEQRQKTQNITPLAMRLGAVSMAAFVLKTVLQGLTIVPVLGNLVFTNRPIIIGFLHLVLLGFVSIYLLAHIVQSGLVPQKRLVLTSIWVFVAGVVFNEVVLFGQGLGFMLMISIPATPYLLLLAAGCLFAGAGMMAATKVNQNLMKSTQKNAINLNTSLLKIRQ